MTPKRRQGSGRAAMDRIDRQLTDALSTLSKVSVSQAVIADVAHGDLDRAAATLNRLDDDMLAALMRVVVELQDITREESNARYNAAKGTSP